ncbi:GNAT family N-acetyltransferase [Auraticoccus monumenti]|uniref:Phosphinothricin acetyltransferase n=1 Tax=Auraticoccus monumenti TaxID=675864 RepID=A0A1G7ERY6_9ACTN|nr:GNAT family N-acetyltransferase [Auraticoccus monumenti]SDE66175.1 phosphinothricin acetyltransferase [Auraticoccus monumenti]
MTPTGTPGPLVRPAMAVDVVAITDIYNHAVVHTTASYDLAPVSLLSRELWFAEKQADGWPVLVVEVQGVVVGWSTFGPFRPKAGFQHTVEHSVYVADGHQGHGLGRALLQPLIEECRRRGVHAMVGGLDADNAGSLAFHRRLGFVEAGRLPQVGRKFDRWLNLVFAVLLLDEEDEAPAGRVGVEG